MLSLNSLGRPSVDASTHTNASVHFPLVVVGMLIGTTMLTDIKGWLCVASLRGLRGGGGEPSWCVLARAHAHRAVMVSVCTCSSSCHGKCVHVRQRDFMVCVCVHVWRRAVMVGMCTCGGELFMVRVCKFVCMCDASCIGACAREVARCHGECLRVRLEVRQ